MSDYVPPPSQFPIPPTYRIGDRDPSPKKALLVGIDYSTHPNHSYRLKWCVYDAREIALFLHESFDFEWGNMQILTDDQPGNLPSKANILAAMRWLVEGARTGDNLFFYFSGHAIQVKDTNGDEPDVFHECICALDYINGGNSPPSQTTPGIISGHVMHDIMVKPLPRGCRLTAVLDCGHSGKLLDLPFIYDRRGRLKSSYDPNFIQQKSSLADVISLSACKVNENAFELPSGGSALRKAFVEYMTSSGSGGTCLDIIRSLRAYMNTIGFRQRPQLSSSHQIDVNQPFII
ncbi:peptidase C14 [Lactarius vividus]|nr:peptidase C14 [Lactarius vividus]